MTQLNVTFHGSKKTVALDDFSLDIEKHEFFSIIGPSGCGKTTFIRVLAGLTAPSSGEVMIDGEKVTGPRPDRAVVFQEYVLLPWRNAQRNVEFGLEMKGAPVEERRSRVRELISLVGLDGFEEYYPDELSGGMQQRVGLARALAVDPKILLMDEPFGSVDAMTKESLQVSTLELWRHTNKTVIFVTHDVEEALFLSQSTIIMEGPPGKITHTMKVPFSYPRDVRLKINSDFLELRSKLMYFLTTT